MKQVFSLLFVSLFFVACQKEEQQVIEQPLAVQSINDVSYGADGAQKMDVFLPAGRTSTATKALIVIHGGAWISGDKADMNQYLPTIKQQLPEYAIFNLNYRLGTSSANSFPAQENDIKAAVDFIMNKAGEYKFNTTKTVLLGASAGGHLALLQGYKQTSPKVKAVVSMFGPTDMAALYNSYPPGSLTQIALQVLMGGTPASNASLYQSSSPVNFVNAQNPPTLLLHGTADPIVPIAQSTALKARLETSGVSVKMVTYQNAGHGDWDDPTFAKAYAEIVSFLTANNQ
jgi:acetyl esterase/lipase